ncbi:MAG: hypothetical protein ABIJ33_03850 [Patescibacteria group bacterium]|nr:hypothetical protein [Patescibacteria group bacterium]
MPKNIKQRFITTLYQLPQTVFTLNELAILFPQIAPQNLSQKLRYFSKTNGLIKLRRGLYAKADYNRFELANKLFSPSYVSLATILEKDGLIFQHDSTIHMISYLSRQVEIADQTFQYHKFKSKILVNRQGLIEQSGVWLASRERAFLDSLYLFGDMYIDNLKSLDWDKLFDLASIYESQILMVRLNDQRKTFNKEYHRLVAK